MNPIFILLRLVFPLIIFRYPLAGGIAAIILDNLDYDNKFILGIGPVGDYQLIDKMCDTYYLILLALVSLRLKNYIMGNVIRVLFVYRMIGFILFEFTQIRVLLFFFPNIFENTFFIYYILKIIAGYEPKLKKRMIGLIILLAALPKIPHEYYIHVSQQPLTFNLFGYPFTYHGTIHQSIYIVIVAMVLGVYFKLLKKR